jgi:hypothetical protein
MLGSYFIGTIITSWEVSNEDSKHDVPFAAALHWFMW